VPRPPKELAGFAKVDLAPQASATARIDLDDRSFARWDPASHRWTVDPGAYRILVAASAVDIRGELEVHLEP
jgi:beta-glucosidase